MWTEFALALALGALLLILPGFVVLKSLHTSSTIALCCSPVASVTLYTLTAIVFRFAGIPSGMPQSVLPALFIAVVVIAVRFAFDARKTAIKTEPRHAKSPLQRSDGSLGPFRWATLALYLALGLASALFVFTKSLDGPASFVQTYDNVFHYGLIRTMADTGNWSPLEATLYSTSTEMFNPVPGESYYPSAWHMVCAMLVNTLGVSVPLSANAVNTLFAGIVFPASMHLFMSSAFADDRRTVVAGAFVVPLFAAFPWTLLLFWPLYPNTASFCLLPIAIVSFMAICQHGSIARSRILAATVFACSIFAIAFMQPNSVFSAMVYLVPFCTWRIFCETRAHFSENAGFVKAVGASAGFLAFVAILWLALYKTPFLQSVIGFYWAPTVPSKSQAVSDALALSFNGIDGQPALAAITVLGVVAAIAVWRSKLWIAASYIMALVIAVVAMSFGDVPLKHFLSGFWYTDPYRVASFATIAAVPVASMGVSFVAWGALRAFSLLRSKHSDERAQRLANATVESGISVLFGVLLATTTIVGPTNGAIAYLRDNGLALNSDVLVNPLDRNEIAFLEKVKEIVPDDALLINQPYDGSLFAYSTQGLDLYYRYLSGYGTSSAETKESALIRGHLDEIGTNEEVLTAIEKTGASYVLLLERDQARMTEFFSDFYVGEAWTGLNAVNDETPCLELVLADEDMRLYRIVA